MASQRIEDSGNRVAAAARTAGKTAEQREKSPDPAQLVAEIERTREDLAETLDAIVDRVSPKRVAQRSAVRLKEVTATTKVVVLEKAATVKALATEKVAAARGTGPERAAPAAVLDSPAGSTPLPPTTGVAIPGLSTRPTAGSSEIYGVPREAIAAGVAAALVVLWLLRRRRSR